MTKSLKVILGIMGVAILTLGVLLFTGNGVGLLGASVAFGPNHYMADVFLQGLYAGTNRQLSISNAGLLTTSGGITNTGIFTNSGALSQTGTFTLGTNGGALSIARSTTATWDPGAVTSSTNASVAVLTPYATVGDSIVASLNSATSTERWFVYGNVTAGSGTSGASTTIYLSLSTGSSTESLDLSTTTIRLLWIR